MMNKLILIIILGMFSFRALAIEEYEVIGNVVAAAKCKQIPSKKAMAKFNTGHRYNQWVEIQNIRQISPVDFEFLIESKNYNSYQWVSASLFKEVRCNVK